MNEEHNNFVFSFFLVSKNVINRKAPRWCKPYTKGTCQSQNYTHLTYTLKLLKGLLKIQNWFRKNWFREGPLGPSNKLHNKESDLPWSFKIALLCPQKFFLLSCLKTNQVITWIMSFAEKEDWDGNRLKFHYTPFTKWGKLQVSVAWF